MTYDLQTVMPLPTKRRRWLLPALLGVVVALVAAGVGAYLLLPGDLTVTGSLRLTQRGGLTCPAEGGFADIRQGAQVTVTDAAGKVVALGHLERGESDGTACVFPFTVGGVPRGAGPYGLEVSRRGVVHYTEEMLVGPVLVTLGG